MNFIEPKFLFSNAPDTISSSIIGTWFSFTSWTIMFTVFGTSFLFACAAIAVYYVLIVVTEPSQQVSNTKSRELHSNYLNWNGLWFYPPWLLSNSNNTTNLSWSEIIKLIDLAYETYSTLELDNLECQEKILCEFQLDDEVSSKIVRESSSTNNPEQKLDDIENQQNKNHLIGDFMRKISNFLLHLDLLKSIPNIKKYQEAIQIGQSKFKQQMKLNQLQKQQRKVFKKLDLQPQPILLKRYTNDSSLLFGPIIVSNINSTQNICESVYLNCKFSVIRFNQKYKALFD